MDIDATAAPEPSLTPESRALPDYTFSEAVTRGAALFKSHWAQLVLASLIVIGISMGISIVVAILDAIAPSVGSVVNLVVSIFVSYPLLVGLMLFGVRQARGDARARPSDVFLVFQGRYLRCVGACFLLVLLTIVVSLPLIVLVVVAAIGTAGTGQTSAWSSAWFIGLAIFIGILMLVGIYYFLCRVVLMPLIVVDPDCGDVPIDRALKESWRLTRGRGWSMLGLFMVVWLAVAASVLLLCVGVFLVGYPFAVATMGAAAAMLVQPLRGRRVCADCGETVGLSGVCTVCGSWRSIQS